MSVGGPTLLPANPQHERKVDGRLPVHGEIQIGEDVVEMIAHQPCGTVGISAFKSLQKRDMLIVAARGGVAAAIKRDHQGRLRYQASQEIRDYALSACRSDGNVEGAG